MLPRSSGVLLPIASLPSHFGIGDLGPSAFRFVDFLNAAGQRVWQVLPLNPTEGAFGHSPYHSASCFALNPLLISPEMLVEEGWVDRTDLPLQRRWPQGRVDYAAAAPFKRALLQKACRRFRQHPPNADYQRFCMENAAWIDDYALFSALSSRNRKLAWDRWPAEVRSRRPSEMRRLRKELQETIEALKIEQYLAYRQWQALRTYCRRKSVLLFGDLPVYVPFHSADVWSHRALFKLDRRHRPTAVSGVPPDYFSADGQLWGHPVYDWDAHRQTRFAWWCRRIAYQISLFDAVRIDHFRGWVAYWEVPAGATTARDGRWVEVPSDDFLSELRRRFVALPLVAEDLGHITADVHETMRRYGFPGMRVLMFGFSGNPAENPNAPQNIPEHGVVYTGTHDNNTVRGWFATEASTAEKQRLMLVAGKRMMAREAPAELVRLAMLSPARWAIFPVQDLLALGAAARLNTPGRVRDNWVWRLTPKQFDSLPAARLLEWTTAFGRV
jgi:4-alpha-glucanotransferase